MWSLCCELFFSEWKRQEHVVDGEDLFAVIELANTVNTAKEFVRECRLSASNIEARFEENGKNKVIVTFKEHNFVFNLVPTENIREAGRIVRHLTPLTCDYYYYHTWNGMEAVTNYFKSLLHIHHHIRPYLNDSNRDLQEICNFYQEVSANSLHIGKTASLETLDLNFLNSELGRPLVMCFYTMPPEDYEIFPIQNTRDTNNPTFHWAFTGNIDCEGFDHWEGAMSGKMLNAYIRNWLKLGGSRMQERPQNAKTIPDLYHKLPFHPWDKDGRAYYLKTNFGLHCDFSHGFDIMRKDGTLATIFYWADSCIFCVWKEKLGLVQEEGSAYLMYNLERKYAPRQRRLLFMESDYQILFLND
ncbi:hypothetical protein CRE_17333 [Caenorhabditis remanei]|uniref:F-box associated domain-containing protein n=1 Tax=Caenorhabditis remanei TaxID=31234 RepID=E3MRZ0_CAERE|nr:hypothetical protein CRE_17333 [Caenorhabditis remanei]